MATLQLTINLTEDGATVPGFPITRSVTSTEVTGRQTFQRATGGGYLELPALSELADVNFVVLTTNKDVTVRFNDQSDGGLALDANGVLVIATCDISGSATSQVSVSNASGETATLTAYVGGE